MNRREFLQIAGIGALSATGSAASENHNGQPNADTAGGRFVSGRPDGRHITTAGFYHAYLKHTRPRLEFQAGMTAGQTAGWREKVKAKLTELMMFPEVPPQPEPRKIWSKSRKGYVLERWEAYPEPYSVVPFYMLVPDGVSARSPAPGVMCFPGSTSSKELLAGEPELPGNPPSNNWKWPEERMAWHYAQRGIVAVAFDNPATNETGSPLRDREALALEAIWMGRCYESVSVFQKAGILHWLARQPRVDPKRIAVSGHSLGTKPADILGVLYPEKVAAVVHNDFLCDWRERALALNLNNPSAHQVVPGLLAWFDYTDLIAALAPKPLLITEGGRTPSAHKLRRAYAEAGAPGAFKFVYYDKYADPASRKFDGVAMPDGGLTMDQYFEYAYVDSPRHRFHPNQAVPWLAKVLGM